MNSLTRLSCVGYLLKEAASQRSVSPNEAIGTTAGVLLGGAGAGYLAHRISPQIIKRLLEGTAHDGIMDPGFASMSDYRVLGKIRHAIAAATGVSAGLGAGAGGFAGAELTKPAMTQPTAKSTVAPFSNVARPGGSPSTPGTKGVLSGVGNGVMGAAGASPGTMGAVGLGPYGKNLKNWIGAKSTS